MRHDEGLFVLLILALMLLAFLRWAFVPRRKLSGHRVRVARIRIRLRLHPGRGHATAFELWLRWGRFAAFRRSRWSRRGLSFGERLIAGAAAYSTLIGRAHYRHGLRVPLEEHALIMAPPRTRKTGWLARVILHYPGPVVSTMTKHDVFELTSGVRARRGPVHVFNPQGIGGVPSTFRWNPLDGCQDPAVAIRRADGFAHAVAMGSVEDASFWTSKASDYLRALFCAAALAGRDMRHVATWVLGGQAAEAEHILASYGHDQWAVQLSELRSDAQKTIATVRMTMSRALSFMADPALMSAVLPGDHDGLDIGEFLQDSGTLYLIAESRVDDSPLVDALVFWLHPPGAAQALGIFLIVLAVFAAIMLTSALPKRALAAVLAVAVPRFLVAGLAEVTGSQPVARAAAVLGFLLAGVALYTAFALLWEDSRGREIVPVGRLGPAQHATQGSLAMQLRDIERQAGVRRTL
jgi:hypothetical protein